MNEKILDTIIENKKLFVPSLFTSKQVNILHKYNHKETLNNTEKAYLYSTIKRKIDALNTLKEEFYICGEDMIPERVEQAKKILNELKPKKAFISGSFLYKKEYNDIDIFILNNRRKSYRQDKKHFTFISEKDLSLPLFVSAAKYSVGTLPPIQKIEIKRQPINSLIFTYQWIINQVLEDEDQKELRDLVFQYFIQVNKTILNARSIDLQVQNIKELSKEQRIKEINRLTKEILINSYSAKYLYLALFKFIKSIKEMSKEYQTENIPIYLNFAKEVQHECRRIET
jgi:hypothetical protein